MVGYGRGRYVGRHQVDAGDVVSDYVSQSARDAERSGYGTRSYWEYLDQTATEHHAYFMARGDPVTADAMLTQSLSASLMGNDGD